MFECAKKDCDLCPRLTEFRRQNKEKYPSYYNGAVEPFGSLDAKLLVVGLAPGLNGANQTNRPFTNDYAGDILYPALKKFGFAKGEYKKCKNDGFELLKTRITNCVRCVPPKNQVTAQEIANCRAFLLSEIKAMKNLQLILALGTVAHGAVLQALGYKKTQFKFKHGAKFILPNHNFGLIDSFHTSRYNINTGTLTNEMFENVVAQIKKMVG